jgi:alkylhydroperoxidase family enzyme
MRPFLVTLLAVGVGLIATPSVSAQAETPAVFPTVPDADAWAKLPPRKAPPLPEWAKMLELDYFHREKNPLGPELSALIRLEVAKVLKSEYGVAAAKADLESVKLPIPRKPHGLFGLVDGEGEAMLAVQFAKKLTLEGHAITDKEFAEVLKDFGPEKTVAIVHTVAYANFHNRVLLGLGVKGESPPLPAVALQFDLDAAKSTAPARPSWDDLKAVKAGGLSVRLNWSEGDAEAMAKKLDQQKERSLRIPLPEKSVYDKLPPKEKESSQRILWNTVSAGYQPEMTRAWFACLYAYYEEAKPDRVFMNSAFWVVTRTNDCFY